MNKVEMAERLATRTGMNQVASRDAVDSLFATIGETVDLSRVETGYLDIEVELDLGERLELDREQLLVPAGQFGQAVVGDNVGANLLFREVAQPDWTLLTKVETSCDRILIAGGANVEAEWEQGPAV